MDTRDARRHVRRDLAEHVRRRAVDPGVIGSPDDRARLIEAFTWVAQWLAPAESSVADANLRPLVRADGSPPDGAPAEWSARHAPDDDGDDPALAAASA